MSIKHPPMTADAELIDEENPEWTEEMFALARPAREVLGDAILDALMARQRGRPKLTTPKVAVKLRLDANILNEFKAAGPGWQTRINEVLAAHVAKAAL